MVKSLYEAPTEDCDLPTEKDGVRHFTAKLTPDVKFSMSEKQLDDLQWAKDFMDRYERKHVRLST